jgi:uncharacterized MnhB-related membrane protein
MILALLVAAILLLALQAIRAERLLYSAIWLASVSALLAILFYKLGAPYVAVIELSVGAGLVTVLFIFAIGMAGEELIKLPPVMPRAAAWGLVIAAVLLLGGLTLPLANEGWVLEPLQVTAAAQAAEEPLQVLIWEQRGLDVLVQVVLIFSGVLGLLGLLAEEKAPLQQSVAEEIAAGRDRELGALEMQIGQQEQELA